MDSLGDKILLKFCSKFYCKNCDYGTSKKSSYDDHLLSTKHKIGDIGDKIGDTNSAFFCLSSKEKHVCENCNKSYVSRNGLWKHKKKCITINQANNHEEPTDKDLIIMLIKQNTELLEIVKGGTTNNNNININNNSNNKTFNLQVFLNDTCKDAMNINDFVSSIQMQLCDLETTGRLGYVEGVSKIILNNLKNLNKHLRPIHCSDPKREVLYIKNENEWIKETDDKSILTKAIKVIANENIKQISQFKKLYPDCTDSESNKNDLYLKIVFNAMSGSTKEETEKNINKIISNLAKSVVIDK